MKAYLIDAINEMVIQIDYKGYEHKCELMKCNMVQVLSIGGKNVYGLMKRVCSKSITISSYGKIKRVRCTVYCRWQCNYLGSR